MILSKKRITKALIRLRGCAGWSAPVLFAKPRRQVFTRCGPNNKSVMLNNNNTYNSSTTQHNTTQHSQVHDTVNSNMEQRFNIQYSVVQIKKFQVTHYIYISQKMKK